MSKRPFDSDFWMGAYVRTLPPYEKLVYAYLINCPRGTIAGIFDDQPDLIAFDLGIDQTIVESILERLEKDGKIIRFEGMVALTKWGKHQSSSPAVFDGILRVLGGLSPEGLRTIKDGGYTLPRGSSWKSMESGYRKLNQETVGGPSPDPHPTLPIPNLTRPNLTKDQTSAGEGVGPVGALPPAKVSDDEWFDGPGNVLGLTESEVRALDRPEYDGIYLDEEYKKMCADVSSGRMKIKAPAKFLSARAANKAMLNKS